MRERVWTSVGRSGWPRARVRVQTKEKEGKWKFWLGFPKDCNSKKSLNRSRPLCGLQFSDADCADRRRLQTFHTYVRVNINGMPTEGIDAISSRSEKEKNLKWQMLPAFSGKALWSPPRCPRPPRPPAPARRASSSMQPAIQRKSAHKKMSDELLAQYRRGGPHFRTRSPRMDMGMADT